MKNKVVLFLVVILMLVIGVLISNKRINPNSPEIKSDRALNMDIKIMFNGEEKNIPATLYVGKGYSVYIPNENWSRLSSLEEDGSDCWSFDSEMWVSFQIARFGGVTNIEEAREQLLLGFEGPYNLKLIEDNLYAGCDEENIGEFQLVGEIGNHYYYLINQYPSERAEEYGVVLNAIADTFEIEYQK